LSNDKQDKRKIKSFLCLSVGELIWIFFFKHLISCMVFVLFFPIYSDTCQEHSVVLSREMSLGTIEFSKCLIFGFSQEKSHKRFKNMGRLSISSHFVHRILKWKVCLNFIYPFVPTFTSIHSFSPTKSTKSSSFSSQMKDKCN
jgi:hypothetical protein